MFYLVSITKFGWEWRSLTHMRATRAEAPEALWLLGVVAQKSLRVNEKAFRQLNALCYIPSRSSIHYSVHTATIPSRYWLFINSFAVSFAPFHPIAVLKPEKFRVFPTSSKHQATLSQDETTNARCSVIVTHTDSHAPHAFVLTVPTKASQA